MTTKKQMLLMRNLHILLVSTVLLVVCVNLGIIPNNFVSWLLGLGCLIFLVYSTPFYPEAIASKNWPTVEGEITTSKIGKKGTHTSGVSSYPIIEYTFTVNGQEYKSKRVKIGTQSVSESGPYAYEDMIKRYHLQRVVKVYYSPKKPEKAVLEPGINIRIYGFTIAGICFYLASLVVGNIAREIANMPDITESVLRVFL